MTTQTSLLRLILPVQGEFSGTWGDQVNAGLTNLLDTAIAGTTTLNTDADVTLTTANYASDQARAMILFCTGTRTAIRNINAPLSSKVYVVINTTSFGVVLRGTTPTTGVTIPATSAAICAWNGSDFIVVAQNNVGSNHTGILPTANGGTALSSFTSGGALYATSTSALTTGTLPVASGGTGATTNAGAAFALKGANGDITSLTALSTPVGLVPSVRGSFANLQASATGLSAVVSVSADELVVEDSAFSYQVLRSVSVSPSLAASGANGLDTGTVAVNSWYAVWVIWNGTTTAGLLSLSATAPTMPSGYTHKARVGWVRSDNTANKFPLSFKQYGRTAKYVVAAGSNFVGALSIASGAAGNVNTPTYVSVGVSSFVPTTASQILIGAYSGVVSGIVILAPNASHGATGSASNPPFTQINVSSTGGAPLNMGMMPLESANVYWASNSATSYLFVSGWEDNL